MDTNYFFIYALSLGLGILIYVLVARATFRINTITNSLLEQTALLKQINETQKQLLKIQEDKKPLV